MMSFFCWRFIIPSLVAIGGVAGAPSSAPKIPPFAPLVDSSPVRDGLGLAINEIHASPEQGKPEFVEIFNGGSESILLSTLTLADSRRSPGVIANFEISVLLPGDFVSLTSDLEGFHAAYGPSAALEMRPWPALNNGGDLVVIALGNAAKDSVAYTGDQISTGVSLERVHPRVPSNLSSNWLPSIDPTGATPGVQNSVFVVDVTPPVIRSAEYVTDHTIEIWFSESINPIPFDETIVFLDGIRPSSLQWNIEYSALILAATPNAVHLELGNVEDYSGNTSEPTSVPIARRPRPGELLISEIMFDPNRDEAGRDYPEFLEVMNCTTNPLSLAAMSLVIGDPAMPERTVDLRRIGYTLAPSSSAVVYSEPTASWLDEPEIQSSLDDAYPGTVGLTGIIRLPVKSASLGLNNTSETVSIVGPGDLEFDSITYWAQWHDDRYRETRGRSLRRITVDAPLAFLEWSSTPDDVYADPGHTLPFPTEDRSIPAGGLVFSEIMYDPVADPTDGRPDQFEYLEVTNVGKRTIDLNGLYLLSGPADRALSDSSRLVYRPTLLGPGQSAVSFVVPNHIIDSDWNGRSFLAAAFPGSGDSLDGVLIPRRSPLGLSNDGEQLELRGPSLQILDTIFYSPGWHHFLIQDGTGASLERIDLNGYSNNPENWTTSVSEDGGTPALDNSTRIPDPDAAGDESRARSFTVNPKTFSPNSDGIDDILQIRVDSGAGFSAISLSVFDIDGRLIKHMPEVQLVGNASTLYWAGDRDDGRPVPPGIYILVAQVSGPSVGSTRTLKTPAAVVY